MIPIGNVPAAKLSPRVEFGILKWYEGDTFKLSFKLLCEDEFGQKVTLRPQDTVTVNFYDYRGFNVHSSSFPAVVNGLLPSIDFGADLTAKFPRGRYTYEIILKHENETTIAYHNQIVVE